MGSTHTNSKSKSLARRIGEAGNVFLMLFGAIGMVGVIGASTMTIMKGPVKTMSVVTKRTIAENNMIATAKLALIASASSATSDCDSDGTLEPIPWTTAIASLGGGEVPLSIGAAAEDPWGNKYGYCTWDHGSAINSGACGGGAGYKEGNATEDGYVVAVISAGPDGNFNTVCNDTTPATLLVKQPGSDDLVLGYTYAEAGTASAGLWNIKSGEPDVAEIQKKLEVTDGSAAQFAFDAALKSLKIGDGTTGTGEFPITRTDNIQSISATPSSKAINIISPLSADENITTAKDLIATGDIKTIAGDVAGATGTFSGLLTMGSLTVTNDATVNGDTILGNALTDTTAIFGDASVGRDLTVANALLMTVGTLKVPSGGYLDITTNGGGASEGIRVGGIHIGGTYSGSNPIDGEIVATGANNIVLKTNGVTALTLNNATQAGQFAANLGVAGNTSLAGNVTLGDDANTDTITFTAKAASNLDMGTSEVLGLPAIPSGNTYAASKKYVDDTVAAGTGFVETDPTITKPLGATGKICRANGTKIECTSDEDDPQIGTDLTSGEFCRWDGSEIDCDQTAGDILTNGGAVDELDDLTDAYVNAVAPNENFILGRAAATALINSAQFNTFIGTNVGATSLNSTVATDWNTGLGYSALSSLTSGDSNTSIGSFANQNLTVGHSNTSIGSYADANNTGGIHNVAVGRNTLRTNVNKSGNTAVGSEAMMSASNDGAANTTFNTAIGYRSLAGSGTPSANTGYFNTALGALSLSGMTSGFENIGIGYQAGDNLTTGRRNIIIGHSVDASSASAAETLNIGDLITGDLGITSADPKVGAPKYCDENLANCFVATDVSGGGPIGAIDDLSDAFTDYTTNDNFIMGRPSAAALTTGALHNTFIGEDAGATSANSTATTDNNTALGWHSLKDLTSGSNNTAFGTLALEQNTVGNYNTAIGRSALVVNTGDQNTAVGGLALSTNSTGLNNSAFGYSALRFNDVGVNNSAFGHGTLVNNTGGNNSAFGTQSLLSNTTGINNVGLGVAALSANVSGNNNIAIGYQASQSTTLGSDNIIIGYAINASSAAANEELNIGNLIKGDLGATSGDPRMGAAKYCDASLANCFVATDVGAGSSAGQLVDADDDTKIQIEEAADDDTIRFDTAGAERMIILPSGNVGIGTNNPTEPLTVSRGLGTQPALNTLDVARFINNDTAGQYAGISIISGNTAGAYIDFGDQNLSNSGAIVYENGNNAMYFNTNGSSQTRLKLTSVGELEFYGDNVLAEKGCVRFNEATDTMQYSHDCATYTDMGTSGGTLGAINDLSDAHANYTDENVIIGRTSAAALTAGAQFNTFVGRLAGATTANSTATTDHNTALGSRALRNLTSGDHNTAIGSNALNANTTGRFNAAIGSQALYRNTTGRENSAIGLEALAENTTGSDNIAIGGDALAENRAKSKNTAVGVSALRYANDNAAIADTYNTAIGYNALHGSTTAANNTGTLNTAIGGQSLASNTSGLQTSAVGFNSLRDNQTGSYNTALGNYALENNVAKSYNVAIGNQAMRYASDAAAAANTYNTAVGAHALRGSVTAANNTGVYNTAVGGQALANNTGGNHNVAVGQAALNANTTATGNTAIGQAALNANTTANNNTAVGQSALSSNTTGVDNSVVGQSALSSNISGNFNTAFGQSALSSNTASGNTAIGSYSLINNSSGQLNTVLGATAGDNITTGSNNIMIGHNTDAPSATSSNALNIGNTIYGDLSTGQIRIGDTSATVPLDLTNSRFQQYTNSVNNDFAIGTAVGAGPTNKADYAVFRSRGTVGAEATVINGDGLGGLRALGYDGDSWEYHAEIQAVVDGPVSNQVIPTSWSFRAGTTASTERMRLSSAGALILGDVFQIEPVDLNSTRYQFFADSGQQADMLIGQSSDGSSAKGDLTFAKSNGTIASKTAVVDGDRIGELRWSGYDGSSFETNAWVGGVVNGSVSNGVVPIDIIFNTGSAGAPERMRLTSAGNFLVGSDTTVGSADNTLQVSGDVSANMFSSASTQSGPDFQGMRSRGTQAAPAIVQNNDKVLGVRGRAYDGASYQTVGFMGISMDGTPSSGSMPSRISFYTTKSGSPHATDTGNNNAYSELSIQSDGQVVVGSSSSNGELYVHGDIEYTGTITDVSDRRLKTDIKPLGSALDLITKIGTYSFKMKDDKGGKTEFGVMAQELEKLYPTLVHTADDEMGTKSVNYTGLTAPIIEAIKEMKAIIDTIMDKITKLFDIVTTLQEENKTLKAEVDTLKSQNQNIIERLEALETSKEARNNNATDK